jgi:hypothetical protein
MTPSNIYIVLYIHDAASTRTYLTLVGRFWKTILFWWLRVTPVLVDHETNCVEKLIFLSFHTYEEHPNWMSYVFCVSIWKQGDSGPWDWLEVWLCNSDLDWISTLSCASPWLSSTLLMSHMSSIIHSILWELAVSREQKKNGMHKDWDVSSGCDMEKETE